MEYSRSGPEPVLDLYTKLHYTRACFDLNITLITCTYYPTATFAAFYVYKKVY